MTERDEAKTAERGQDALFSAKKPNPIDVHVGSRLRLRRMLLGMSQEKLGERLGLTFQQIQKYEKGVNRIGASRLYQLAHILSVPVQFFYEEMQLDEPAEAGGTAGTTEAAAGGFAESESENLIIDFLNSREGLELNRAFARIRSPRTRRSIIELVRSLASSEEEAGADSE